MSRNVSLLTVLAIALLVTHPASARGLQGLVDDANATLERFVEDPEMQWFRDNMQHAHGVLIVPRLVRAGFLFGGSGGSGVFMARDPDTGEWSYPAFYSMGSGSFGLQAGGDVSSVVMMMMTSSGVDAMLASGMKLGADASVAAGPVGIGTRAATVDVLAFSRSKGFYGGLTAEGTWIEPRDGWNEEYYQTRVRPIEILVRRSVENPDADRLRANLERVASQTTDPVPLAGIR